MVGGSCGLPVLAIGRLQLGRRPYVDALHRPAGPRHRYGGKLSGFDVRGVRLVGLVVSARHSGNHLGGLLHPHLGSFLLGGGRHHGENREAGRQLGQLGWHGWCTGDVDTRR